MKWLIASNYFNIWQLYSHDKFVTYDPSKGPTARIFTGIKHQYSGLTGITTYVHWIEKLANVSLSNQGYAAYVNVEGDLTFSFKLLSSTTDVNETNYFTYDGVF